MARCSAAACCSTAMQRVGRNLTPTHCLRRLLGELMIRDGSNLASGTALLKRLHFGNREILTGTNNHADGQLRCAFWPSPRVRCG